MKLLVLGDGGVLLSAGSMLRAQERQWPLLWEEVVMATRTSSRDCYLRRSYREDSSGGGLVAKSCLTLCDPMDCRDPHGLQTPLSLEFPFPSLGDLPDPGIEPESPALASRFFITEPPGIPYREGGSAN